ncbi:photoreceptor cilium actin regulator-like [Salvelinus namaycush]|uniref:Photoreceptor cilium actin regulator-like n=1 Tax=Salvelinus namaycush TaxID=8040 RepID=A0A8U0P5W5_SALNM|nr:photoreceptor cilium actin regulator-like [Salvelinus namaycush]
MGCSPSKGHLFPGIPDGVHKALLPVPPEVGNIKPVEGENQDINNTDIDEEVEELPLSAEEENPMGALGTVADMAPNTAVVSNLGAVSQIEVKMTSQVRNTQSEELPEKQAKKVKKRRKNKGVKRGCRKEKETNTSIIQGKVDLPMHMVRAHQAAYEYLNPNISKCETLLGLLDQAAQTQLSLQPMMTAIVMRFEEVNQALEEMAEEGELMLKEHGNHMAWPSEIRDPAPTPSKPNADPSETPPDLLQLLLQHSTEKMKLVGSSIQGLGDTALEEAADFFASLSRLLGERLQAKRAVEERLTQVLARVEAAAKCNLDDLSLHSEDSGIGGENESLMGSERHRRQWGSSGSGGSARPTPPSHSPDQVCLNEGEEGEENEEEDDDNEDEEDEEEERSGRVRSNSSPPDPIQNTKHSKGQPPKRPQTAAPLGRPVRPPRSLSIESLHVQELQQKDLDRRKGNNSLRRYSSGGQRVARYGLKGSTKANQAPNSLPAIAPQPPGRNSVKRLINTFSGGVDGRPGQSLPSAHLRGSRSSGTPLLPDIGSGEDIVNGNNNKNIWAAEGGEGLDDDNLPPPPPEVLMDNSYESNEENPDDEEGEEEDTDSRGHPVPRQRSTASQRLRASLQNMTVLPNRGSVGPIRQDPETRGGQQPASEGDQENEQAASLYHKARKIIHLRNAAESAANKPDQGVRGPLRAGVSLRHGSSNPYEGEYYPTSMPPTVPPVSRVRLPPSCPSTHHRLPSPPAFAQPNPPSRPPSPRVLRWSKEDSGEDMSPSVSFNDARSVFCQNSQTNSQSWTPHYSSTLPRPYGEPSRGRLSTRGSQTVSRRSQSDQRPSLTTQQQDLSNPGTPRGRTRGSEPNMSKSSDRMVNGLVMEGDNQSDPSAVDTDLDPEQ